MAAVCASLQLTLCEYLSESGPVYLAGTVLLLEGLEHLALQRDALRNDGPLLCRQLPRLQLVEQVRRPAVERDNGIRPVMRSLNHMGRMTGNELSWRMGSKAALAARHWGARSLVASERGVLAPITARVLFCCSLSAGVAPQIPACGAHTGYGTSPSAQVGMKPLYSYELCRRFVGSGVLQLDPVLMPSQVRAQVTLS